MVPFKQHVTEAFYDAEGDKNTAIHNIRTRFLEAEEGIVSFETNDTSNVLAGFILHADRFNALREQFIQDHGPQSADGIRQINIFNNATLIKTAPEAHNACTAGLATLEA